MSVVLNPTAQQTTINQPAAPASQPIRNNWDLAATHATIDSTCDKIGTFIIDAGNLVGGPVAAASLNAAIEHAQAKMTANYPDSAPRVNAVLDMVKVPLVVSIQKAGPAIAESSTMIVMPVPRKLVHGSADLAYGSANLVGRSVERLRNGCS